jgi:hypothetical protein
MRDFSTFADVLGVLYIVVDKQRINPNQQTGTAVDNLIAKPYIYMVLPQNMMDASFNPDGTIRWCLIRETYRDDEDPYNSTGEVVERFRLWEVGKWTLFNAQGGVIEQGETGLDVVPVIPFYNESTRDDFTCPSLVSDVAYIDKAIFNNWSRLDVIINDQTFSQLIMPVQGIVLTEDDEEKQEQYIRIATNRILLYDVQAGVAPTYISPDASQANLILNTIQIQTKQLYSVLGLAQEVGTEITTASGVAKHMILIN